MNAAVADGAKGLVYAGVGDGSISVQVELRRSRLVKRSPTGSQFADGIGASGADGEEKDDENDFVVADNLNPQKARILLMLALTKTSDAKAIQEMFYTY